MSKVVVNTNILPQIAHSFCSVFLVEEELNVYFTTGQAKCWSAGKLVKAKKSQFFLSAGYRIKFKARKNEAIKALFSSHPAQPTTPKLHWKLKFCKF